MKRRRRSNANEVSELLKDILIVELRRAGVDQLKIRQIVGCDIHRVSRITRYITKTDK